MKARLIINEIKQNNPISGLGPIGVGKNAITRGYDHATSHWPNKWSNVQNMKDAFIVKPEDEAGRSIITDCYKDCFNKIEELFNIDLDDFKWMPVHGDSSEEEWSFDYWAKHLPMEFHELQVSDDYIGYRGAVKYSQKYGIGGLSIKPWNKGIKSGFFLRYK
jgi:hypothetical protein